MKTSTQPNYHNSPDPPRRGRRKGSPMLSDFLVSDLVKSCGDSPLLVRVKLTPAQMKDLGIKVAKTSQGAVQKAMLNRITRAELKIG